MKAVHRLWLVSLVIFAATLAYAIASFPKTDAGKGGRGVVQGVNLKAGDGGLIPVTGAGPTPEPPFSGQEGRWRSQMDSQPTGFFGDYEPQVLAALNEIRRETDRFHEIDHALWDGYRPTTSCVSGPGGAARGIAYYNPIVIKDPAVRLIEPEILLYIPNAGGLRLVGVEYLRMAGETEASAPELAPAVPSLAGQTFSGPLISGYLERGSLPGSSPREIRYHYSLVVWAWEENPQGAFARFNPNLRCP